MHGEGALDADAVGNAAHGERLAHARARARDDDALERLNALARSLDDLDVHAHRIAGSELGDVRAQLFLLQSLNDVHLFSSLISDVLEKAVLSQRTAYMLAYFITKNKLLQPYAQEVPDERRRMAASAFGAAENARKR